ncbi:hypothetical protein [Erwinia aphidicola]|uniref:hypothetical protein n=1 Tax=Erwinia aphidicola TaxID=68334 RepID=UPI000789ED4E
MFSNRTIQEIVKAIKFSTHTEFDDFLIYFELPEEIGGLSISKKENSLVNFLIKNRDLKGPDNSNLSVEIIEHIIKKGKTSFSRNSNLDNLNNTLKKDGYELTENSVRKILPDEIPVAQTENRLNEILNKYGFSTAISHYNQAIASHGRGDWAAANSQLRTFVEDFFNQVHCKIQAGNGDTTNQKRGELEKAKFFRSEYNEYLHNGTGFIEGFWKRLHPQGSHPGLSEEEDSTFRLHLVLIVIHYYAERLDATLTD